MYSHVYNEHKYIIDQVIRLQYACANYFPPDIFKFFTSKLRHT